MGKELRLIVDPPRDGPTNMAADEAMLLAAEDDADGAALRLYRWSGPTLSLGYFQPFGEVALQGPGVGGLPVVRRVTGGGAIVHADELTYCLVSPTGALPDILARPAGGDPAPAGLYEWMHAAIATAAESLGGQRGALSAPPGEHPSEAGGRRGPFWCFRRRSRFDLLGGGEKVAGSAQRRTGRAVLQHGSVILKRSFACQGGGALAELLGREVTFEEFAAALTQALRDAGACLTPGELPSAPGRAVEWLRLKHASSDWLRRR